MLKTCNLDCKAARDVLKVDTRSEDQLAIRTLIQFAPSRSQTLIGCNPAAPFTVQIENNSSAQYLRLMVASILSYSQ